MKIYRLCVQRRGSDPRKTPEESLYLRSPRVPGYAEVLKLIREQRPDYRYIEGLGTLKTGQVDGMSAEIIDLPESLEL